MFEVQRQTARSWERKSGKRSPERAYASAQPMPDVQRTSCACGGGCPRCRKNYPLQAKLEVSQPGDILEQEADRVAEEVLRMPQPEHPDNTEAHESTGLRLSCYSSNPSAQSSPGVPPVVHNVVHSPGEPLDPATRTFMEPRFGHDFSQVRVHVDSRAAVSAQDVDALAYTVGRDIVFAPGQFAPHTASGRRLLAHELTHVVQQSHGTDHTLQREPQKPGECDPANLGILGKPGMFVRPEADVKAMGLPEKYVKGPTMAEEPEADFVLYCPHASTRPLRRLVPCTKVYWVGDAEASKKGKGKDEVWARQEDESMLVWGYVKKTKIQDTIPTECQPSGMGEVGPPSPTDAPDTNVPNTEIPESEQVDPQALSEEQIVEPSIGTGKTMRINAPNDPGWAEVTPMYLWFKFGEPLFLPHFLKVMVVATYTQDPDYHLVFVEEGRYEGKDVMIHRDYLQDDPGTPGYADTRYDVGKSEFYYGGVGPIKTRGTSPERAPPPGVHELSVPDFPHDKGAIYGPYATSWFLIGDSGDKYLHPGFASLGCATIEIKMDNTTTWPAIWTYLIDARKEDGVVGQIEVVSTRPSD